MLPPHCSELMSNPLEVRSSSHAYHVHIGRGLVGCCGELARALAWARSGAVCAVVTDENVGALYAAPVMASLETAGLRPSLITVPAGEASKSMDQVARVADRLVAAAMDRHGFIVALGGGVVGDLAGFVASIYHRGVPFIQIPTTVIAQCDSAIGGKTGVNTVAGKNLLGSFYPPALVLADVATLASLPDREFNEGFAEVIKHGIIRDHSLIGRTVALRRDDHAELAAIVRRNLEIKAEIVAQDEFERHDLRALLNFGHTVGHAIEQAAGYGHFLHGEAVSLGMVAAARLSMRKAGLPASQGQEIVAALQRFDLPTTLSDVPPTTAILESLARDKKIRVGADSVCAHAAFGLRRRLAAGSNYLGRSPARGGKPAPTCLIQTLHCDVHRGLLGHQHDPEGRAGALAQAASGVRRSAVDPACTR